MSSIFEVVRIMIQPDPLYANSSDELPHRDWKVLADKGGL